MLEKKKISIFLIVLIIFSHAAVTGIKPAVEARHYSGGIVVPCNITIRTNILPVYYSDLSSPRNNPDRTYYPGDAFHFIIQYAGSDTCRNFTVHPLQSSGGLTVTDHKGTNHQHGSSIVGYSEYSSYKKSHPFESSQSVATFENTIQKLCNQNNARVNAGCVSGHAEIAVEPDELNQIHCTTNEKTKREVCAEIENRIKLKVSGQKKVCRTFNDRTVCFWVTISRTATFTPSILNPNISINVTKENLTDSDGYTIRNLDGTYYLWDAINVIHWPIYKWQNERGGTLETVTTKRYDITNEKEFECQKKSSGICDYTLEHNHITPWNKVFDHGAGFTIYNGTSEGDLGSHSFQYSIELFNIGRYLNTTSGSTDALIVRYEPVYENYPYNMLEDNHWWAYGNRPAVAVHYYGSEGGGPDDSPGIHEQRRSKINGFDYSGYAFDPVYKVFLNETMSWDSAESIMLQTLLDRCNKEVSFDPDSFEAENDSTANPKDSAMFVESGYGKIIFSYPILRTMLKERFHDVTIDNTLQSIHFGGRQITNVTDYEYTYPRIKFHTSVKVLVMDSQGKLNQVPVSIEMNPQFDKGAEYTQDYVCKKILHDTQDDGFSDIVLDDMYGKDVNKKNGTGYVNLKSSLTSTWFPDYTEAFFANTTIENHSSVDQKNTYEDILDIPLNFGFGALSPYDIIITADNDNSHIFDGETFQFYSNHLFVVNLDQDNILNITRNENNKNLIAINYDQNFGPIGQVLVDGKEYERRCRTGCSMIISSSDESVVLEAYNIWGGRAITSLDPMESNDKNIEFDESDIIWYAILGVIAGIILWRESKRILRWLGFSTLD